MVALTELPPARDFAAQNSRKTQFDSYQDTEVEILKPRNEFCLQNSGGLQDPYMVSNTVCAVRKGIAPGFAWNQGKTGRDFSVLQSIIPKIKTLSDENNKAFLQSLLSNQIYKTQFAHFVANAFGGKHKGKEIAPVGFFDRRICRWLKKNQKIDVGTNTVIGLESRLIKGIKAARHGIRKEDAQIILEAMLYGKTYWYADPHNNAQKDALIYLYPVNTEEWMRLVVRPMQDVNGIKAPFIRSVGYLSNKEVENLHMQMIEIK